MAKFAEMDEQVTFSKQMEEDIGGPVILINKFAVNPEDVDQLLKTWTADASIFKQQPGYISAQLHRGIAGSGTFINYAVWESLATYKKAVSKLTFRPDYRTTPPALWHHLTSSRKSRYQRFVTTESL
jgi:quinol monooxygenase YgiN